MNRNCWVGKGRPKYVKHREKVVFCHDGYVLIVVDDTDQSTFGLPHIMTKTQTERGHSVKICFFIILEHTTRDFLRVVT